MRIEKIETDSDISFKVEGFTFLSYDKKNRKAELSLYWLKRALEIKQIPLEVFIHWELSQNITSIVNYLVEIEDDYELKKAIQFLNDSILIKEL